MLSLTSRLFFFCHPARRTVVAKNENARSDKIWCGGRGAKWGQKLSPRCPETIPPWLARCPETIPQVSGNYPPLAGEVSGNYPPGVRKLSPLAGEVSGNSPARGDKIWCGVTLETRTFPKSSGFSCPCPLTSPPHFMFSLQ